MPPMPPMIRALSSRSWNGREPQRWTLCTTSAWWLDRPLTQCPLRPQQPGREPPARVLTAMKMTMKTTMAI